VLVAALPVIFLPSFALAQSAVQYISVSPAEIDINNLPPGETAEFELTIRNQEELAHVFTLTTFQPTEHNRREGRAGLPDDSWITFSPRKVEVDAGDEASVKVTVDVPPEQEWAGKDWEIWLGVAAESDELLVVKLYVRLLVSTMAAAEAKPSTGLVVGIAAAAILLGCGAYYCLKHKTRA
jgi:hypothetical protein